MNWVHTVHPSSHLETTHNPPEQPPQLSPFTIQCTTCVYRLGVCRCRVVVSNAAINQLTKRQQPKQQAASQEQRSNIHTNTCELSSGSVFLFFLCRRVCQVDEFQSAPSAGSGRHRGLRLRSVLRPLHRHGEWSLYADVRSCFRRLSFPLSSTCA